MKVIRLVILLLSISIVLMIQACGSGGGSSDTAGALTISAPSAADNANGTSTVTFTVTYAPPSGKTAQGVVVSVNVNGFTDNATLTSGSNSVTYSLISANGSTLSISASVNSMTSSKIFFVPVTGGTGGTGALTVTPTTANFIFTDPAASTKTITISGGTAPYTVVSSVPLEIGAIMATPTTVTVTLINAASSPSPGTSFNATVTVTDSATPAATKTVAVTYLK